MARPVKKRKVCLSLKTSRFQPFGIPSGAVCETILEVDEMEAVRLADLEGQYHEDGAEQMGISRQTFGNILMRAHQKIAQALIGGHALQINCPRFAAQKKGASRVRS